MAEIIISDDLGDPVATITVFKEDNYLFEALKRANLDIFVTGLSPKIQVTDNETGTTFGLFDFGWCHKINGSWSTEHNVPTFVRSLEARPDLW